MRYGYACSSSKDLNAREQIQRLREAGCEAVFSDTGSSQHPRKELENLLSLLAAGDVLITVSLDRLGPSLSRVLELLSALASVGVAYRTLDGAIDTEQPQHASFLAHAQLFAACDKTLAIERMLEGRASAKQKGLKLGRRPKLNDDQVAHGRKLLELGETGRAVAKTLGISEPTLYRYLKAN